MVVNQPSAILIAGPTASGKSRLALELAEAMGGALINTDASQVYTELCILSARPDEAELARAPHHLYGHVAARERYSVARWLSEARSAIADSRAAGRIPILVGGTGLYFTAALEGLADLPPIPQEAREEARRLYDSLGRDRFNDRLAILDPQAAQRISPGDRARSVRAYEVARATGKPLQEWFGVALRPLVDAGSALRLVVMPERAALYAACDRRFDAMLAKGAVEEVHALLALQLSPSLPAMKAVGVEELTGVISGSLTVEAATHIAKRRTRNYAKRQLTWIRHRMADWRAVPPGASAKDAIAGTWPSIEDIAKWSG